MPPADRKVEQVARAQAGLSDRQVAGGQDIRAFEGPHDREVLRQAQGSIQRLLASDWQIYVQQLLQHLCRRSHGHTPLEALPQQRLRRLAQWMWSANGVDEDVGVDEGKVHGALRRVESGAA